VKRSRKTPKSPEVKIIGTSHKSPDVTFIPRSTVAEYKADRDQRGRRRDRSQSPDVFLKHARRKRIQFSKAISRLKPVNSRDLVRPGRISPRQPSPPRSNHRHPNFTSGSNPIIPAQPPAVIDLSEEPIIQAQARSVKYTSFFEDQKRHGFYYDIGEKQLFDECVELLVDLERKAHPPVRFYPNGKYPKEVAHLDKIVETFHEISYIVRFTIKNSLVNLHQELAVRTKPKLGNGLILEMIEDFLMKLFEDNPFTPSGFPPTRVLKQIRNYVRFRVVALEPLSRLFSFPQSTVSQCRDFLRNTFNNDDEFREDYFILNLTDSYSLKRFKYPGRGLNCDHRNVFDLKLFIDRYAVEKKGMCPICDKLVDFSELRFDSFIFSIVQLTGPEFPSVKIDPTGKYVPFDPVAKKEEEVDSSSDDDDVKTKEVQKEAIIDVEAIEKQARANFIDLRFESDTSSDENSRSQSPP